MATGVKMDQLRAIIDADRPTPGVAPSVARGFLAGCAGLYDAGLEAYLAAEQVGLRRRDRLPVPVISIGNLTVGGTGKTPMTAMLCRRLADRGLKVTLLSRGHGGSSQETRIVSHPDGRIVLGAADAGDEPVLLANLCPGIPVLVGKDRRSSGREALRQWPVDVFVLDDGFQFWQLTRDMDIVLLDARRPFDNGYPLPRGLLREPARHLNRAAMVVVTRADCVDAGQRSAILDRIAAYAPGKPVYFARHQPTTFIKAGVAVPLQVLAGIAVSAVSAIAQPESFHRTLTDAGCKVVDTVVFDDHHHIGAPEIEAVNESVRRSGAAAVVLTEKDAVKWPPDAYVGSVPVYSLRIDMALENEATFMEQVMKAVKQSN